MKPLPIRMKFALWSALAMTCAVSALAIGTLVSLYRRQVVEADLDIISETKELEALLPGHFAETISWDLDPDMGWTVFDAAGRMLRHDAIIPEEAARPALGQKGIVRTGGLRHGWRVQAFPAGPERTVVVGYDMVKVYGVLADLVISYIWSLPLVVCVSALAAWWATQRAHAPIRELARAMKNIHSEHLKERVAEPPAQDDIRELTVIFNALLARLEKSFEQTKRFAADASHELRTPLTIMRGEIGFMLREPICSAEQQKTLLSLQEEIARLDRISEQLLQLARFDAGQINCEKTVVDFSRLVAEACEDAEVLASAEEIAVTSVIEPNVKILGDANHLRRLLLNLLDNACKYNLRKGRIRCALNLGVGSVVLKIANTGPGIPKEMHGHVFERFFRADSSRASGLGHGLGLALAKEIAALHNGSLILEGSDSEWTEFQVSFPAELKRAPPERVCKTAFGGRG